MTVSLLAFGLSLAFTPLAIKLSRRWGVVDVPGGRRAHQGEVPRLGGIALFAGFVGTGLFIFFCSATGLWWPMGEEDGKLLTGVLLGSIFMFLFGLADDLWQFPPRPQFVAQFGVALLAIAFDIIVERVTLPVWV